MTKNSQVRVRFAPSPTGFMHLGNVRSALINYLFAKQKAGTFILRIEDTDVKRNTEASEVQIIEDLAWLNLNYDEGPIKGGQYAPYYQSERSDIYKQYLKHLEEKKFVYRCFCTQEELDKKRKRQLALKQPPKYDRACLKLDSKQIEDNLANKVPFIWRFRLDENKTVSFFDLAHKEMHFELKHFSDIPLTRQDGSFTFMFANFVDDLTMKITHVFRGEDHLTNTAGQVALYHAFNATIPVFWHLPIIGNKEGKKLSKRDFGFSLTDLKNEGFLPEAICNYLAIIGGSFEKEVMSLEELLKAMNFDHISTTGMIKYDYEKLRWINHQWISKYQLSKLTELCKEFILPVYPEVKKLAQEKLENIIKIIQPELVTLKDSVHALEFYFKQPDVTRQILDSFNLEKYHALFHSFIPYIRENLDKPEQVVTELKRICTENKYPLKEIFTLFRVALTGKPQGPGILDLFTILGPQETYKRLEKLLI